MKSFADFKDDHILDRVDPEPFRTAMMDFYNEFLMNYRSYIQQHYNEYYERYPNLFPLMQHVAWKTVFNNGDIDNYLFYSGSGNDDFQSYVNQFVTLGELREFHRLPECKKKDRVMELIDCHKEPTYFLKVKYGFPSPAINTDPDYVTKQPSDMKLMGEIEGRKLAELHGDTVREEKFEQFNLFGLHEVIKRVNSPSFEYELGESLSAYCKELYLAAAATGGIALENILRILIERKLGSEKLPEKTYILHSMNVLKNTSIIPGRLNKEIYAQNTIRSGNSHTNEDPVKMDTLETLYRVIHDISILLA